MLEWNSYPKYAENLLLYLETIKTNHISRDLGKDHLFIIDIPSDFFLPKSTTSKKT